jgi:hypothetical protein
MVAGQTGQNGMDVVHHVTVEHVLETDCVIILHLDTLDKIVRVKI